MNKPNYQLARLLIAATLALATPVCLAADKPSTQPATQPAFVIPQAALDKAVAYADESGTQVLLVMIEGKTILTHASARNLATRPHALASGSKSFLGTTYAAAVQDGLVKFDDLACDTLTEWKTDPRKSRITIRQLLGMSSGLDAGENLQSASWADSVAADTVADPGQKFEYGPNHLQSAAELLQRKLKAAKGLTYEQYLDQRILQPLKIQVRWMRCPDGNVQVAGGAIMTAADWATFGEFIRHEGSVDGKSIIDPVILREVFVPQKTLAAYGMTWWLKSDTPQKKLLSGLMVSDAAFLVQDNEVPKDFVMAAGLGKQRLYIIPSLGLTVVRFGPVLGKQDYDDAKMISLLLGAK